MQTFSYARDDTAEKYNYQVCYLQVAFQWVLYIDMSHFHVTNMRCILRLIFPPKTEPLLKASFHLKGI
jgi:hypothetical protein